MGRPLPSGLLGNMAPRRMNWATICCYRLDWVQRQPVLEPYLPESHGVTCLEIRSLQVYLGK